MNGGPVGFRVLNNLFDKIAQEGVVIQNISNNMTGYNIFLDVATNFQGGNQTPTAPIITLAADNATLTTNVYNLYASIGNWNSKIPAFASVNVGDVIYLRFRGGNTLTINRSSTNYTATFFYAGSSTSNSLALTQSGEYIFRCTGKNTSTSTLSFDVTVTNPAALRTTDDLSEGATNKYASATNVRPLLSATAPIVYTSATGVISTTLTQYTDALARSAAGAGLASGNATNTGITFTNNTGASRIDAVVSLAGFSVNALSDVDTATTAPTNGQALVWESASSQWKPGTVSGGGGGARITITNKTSNFAITDPVASSIYEEHYTMDSTSALTFTLPTAAGNNGLTYHITRVNTGAVTVATVSAQTISGLSSVSIPTQWGNLTIRSNGSNWIIC